MSNLLKEDVEALKNNVDDFFLLINGIVIFFMQCGFAFLECGSVRSKNTTNILIKNLLESCCAGISYWIIGFPLAHGDRNPEIEKNQTWKGEFFFGNKYWASYELPEEQYSKWFFHFVFAATASTIVSGAVAERCEFAAYLVYSFVITGFLYPVVTHWCWSPLGWLAKGQAYKVNGTEFVANYQDFAGSGPVHVVGGVAAFIAAAFLGPRLGRFDDEGRPQEIKGHSVPLAALGGFILLFGFFSFNGGSQASISSPGDGPIVARAILNTVLAGSFAAFVGLILTRTPKLGSGKWSLLTTINCALAGFVSICAGCNAYHPWSAAVTGAIAAVMYKVWSWLVLKLKIDDPLDAVAVHAGGGIWGAIAVPIFHPKIGLIFKHNKEAGLFMLWQLIGVASIIGWTAVICIVTFGSLRLVRLLRVTPEIEIKGLDIPKHGEPAYPITAYGHGWGDTGSNIFRSTSMNAMNGGGPIDTEHHEHPEVLTHVHSQRSLGHTNQAFTSSSNHVESSRM